MSEVEKMMQNANIKKHWNSTPYRGVEEYYPPFTAEKQIELIKFLFNQGLYYSTFPNDTYQFHISDDIENPQPRKFDIAIAEIINDLWQELTEEEKQQVKGILE